MTNITEISKTENSNPIYYVIFYQFVHPVFILCGITGNIWILVTMGLRSVRISSKTKLYYFIIGLSDLSIVCCNLMWGDLCDSLYIWTAGNFFFCFESVSDNTCKVIRVWYYLSDIISNYALVALSIERFVAVFWPLQAKYLLTNKLTFFLLFSLIVPCSLFYIIVIPLGSSITPTFRAASNSCSADNNSIFGYIFNVSMPIVILGIHTIVDLIISILIFYQLYFSRSNKLEELSSNSKMVNTKEISATLTLICLCLINTVIYGTCLIAYMTTVILSYYIIVPASVFYFFLTIFILSVSSTPFPHSINVFIYLILIPSFREVALCRFKYVTSGKSSSNVPGHN